MKKKTIYLLVHIYREMEWHNDLMGVFESRKDANQDKKILERNTDSYYYESKYIIQKDSLILKQTK